MKQSWLFYGLVFLGFVSSCLAAEGDACEKSEDCGDGFSCRDKLCLKKCKSTAMPSDCTDKQTCDSSLCRTNCASAACKDTEFCTNTKKVCKPKSSGQCVDSAGCTAPTSTCDIKDGADSGNCKQKCSTSADCTDPKKPTCPKTPTFCTTGCVVDSDCTLGVNKDNGGKTKCEIKEKSETGSCRKPCKETADCAEDGTVCTDAGLCKKGSCATGKNKEKDCTDGQICVGVYSADDDTGSCEKPCKASKDCKDDTLYQGRACREKNGEKVCQQGCEKDEDCPPPCIIKNDGTCPMTTGGCYLNKDGACPEGSTADQKEICDTSRLSATRLGDCRIPCAVINKTDTCAQKVFSVSENKSSEYPQYCKGVVIPKTNKMILYCTPGTPPKQPEGGPATASEEKKKPKPGKGKGKGKGSKGMFPAILQKFLDALRQVKNYFTGSSS